jgi:hypothetical protein
MLCAIAALMYCDTSYTYLGGFGLCTTHAWRLMMRRVMLAGAQGSMAQQSGATPRPSGAVAKLHEAGPGLMV